MIDTKDALLQVQYEVIAAQRKLISDLEEKLRHLDLLLQELSKPDGAKLKESQHDE